MLVLFDYKSTAKHFVFHEFVYTSMHMKKKGHSSLIIRWELLFVPRQQFIGILMRDQNERKYESTFWHTVNVHVNWTWLEASSSVLLSLGKPYLWCVNCWLDLRVGLCTNELGMISTGTNGLEDKRVLLVSPRNWGYTF